MAISLGRLHPISRRYQIGACQISTRTEGLTIDGILDWLRTNRPKVYQEYGAEKLRHAIKTTLNQQPNRKERTVWQYEDGTWRLDNSVMGDASAKRTTEETAYTPITLGVSSTVGQTSDGSPGSYEDMPRSELQETRERHHTNDSDVAPAAVSRLQAENGLISIDSQPRAQVPGKEVDAGNETLRSHAATLSNFHACDQTPDRSQTLSLAQCEPAVGSTLTMSSNEPSSTESDQGPVELGGGSNQDGKDESDLGGIVRELRQMEQERKVQEQKMAAGHNDLPDISALTQTAEEAQRAAEAAKKALEEARAEQSQIIADELYLEKLTRRADLLPVRSRLDID